MREPVRFPKEAKKEFTPHPDVLKLLEDTLALAKEGKIQAVGVACVYHDGLNGAGATFSTWAMGPGTQYGMTHAITALQAAWSQAILEQN